jgi:hypothetical protein
LVWGAELDAPKNGKICWSLALGGRGDAKQQSISGVGIGCWRGGAETVGGHRPIIWGVKQSDAKKIKMKYTVTFIGCQLPIGRPTQNNQPK